ncbi:MAG: NACHT domain-containing NTPase, partial [Granulosicoccus sp.]
MSPSGDSQQLHAITLFLASPSDTARSEVASIVAAVGSEPAYRDRVALKLQRWDDRSQPVPMPFLRCPQAQVEQYKTPAERCDLVIGLLKHRLGSSLKDVDAYGVSDVTGNTRTGTEWELHQASVHGIETWVFRDMSAHELNPSLGRDEREAQQQQFNWVCDYFEHFGDPGHTHKGSQELNEQFERLLREWLTHQLQALDVHQISADDSSERVSTSTYNPSPLTALQQSVKQMLLEGKTPESDTITALYRQSSASDSLEAWLLRRWAYWARRVEGVATDAGQLHQHFVTLQMMLDRSRAPDAPPLSQLDGERWAEEGRYESLPQLLADNPEQPGWVLVGPAGSGKSTVLQHYEMHCCENALRAINGMTEKGACKPQVCLWFRLSAYAEGSAEPGQWLEQSWNDQNPDMPGLAWMQANCHVRFLLDGLNEIRAGDRATRAGIVSSWARWADSLPAGTLAPLFSVRTNEYSDQLSADGFHASRINLLLWSEEKIRAYIDQRLSESSADALWGRINTPQLLAFHALPMTLAHQCELFETHRRPLTDRASMFSGLMWLHLVRLQRELPDGLLTERDCQRIGREPWHKADQIHNLPQQGCLIRLLQQLALSMQQRGNEVSITENELDTHLAQLDTDQQDAWLQAVERLQVAEVDPNGQFRFLHQSWQEYFAARALCNLPDDTGMQIDFSAPELEKDLEQTRATLAIADELPVPPPSRWEETAKRLLELLPALNTNKLQVWFDRLRQQNPALAAVAAEPIRDKLSDGVVAELQSDLLLQSRDAAIDLRIRIKSALALGQLGDPRYEEKTGPEGHRYRMPRDDYLITIPAGHYPIGSARDDAAAYDDEHWPDGKVGSVSLDAFKLSFAPVTHAEFACFVEAGGYDDARWWEGADAERWLRGEYENTERQTYWRRFWHDAQQDATKALAQHAPNATDYWKETSYKTLLGWSEAELEGWIKKQYGAQQHRIPAFWDDPRFSSATQPVVG